MQGLLSLLKTLGPARLGAMGAVAAILIGFFGFVIMRLSATPMAQLYSDLTLEDASAIVAELDAANVSYEIRSGGTAILAPRDDVLRLRMQLAQDGLPSGGSLGYEIFDQTSTLGATSFVQNLNHLRALEGELARSIRTIDRVTAARVHLVIPERQIFRRDAVPPTASIMLKLRGMLDGNQIQAIQHLVASAVEGLKPERVSIVDEGGRLLASGEDNAPGLLGGAAFAERSAAFEARLRNEVEEIVSSVVGPDRARVQVAAEFELNEVTETRESFDPESQVVRSQQTRSEESASGAAGGAVSVANALPGGGAAGGPGGSDSSTVTEETVNYEIARTTRTEVIGAGQLRRVSVAVLVDGVYTANAEGAYEYAPRSQEELDRIGALVRSAVGFDQARGDVVEVVNLRFAEAPRFDEVATADAAGGFLGLEKGDYFYLAELGLAVVLGLLVIFLVVRPLIRRIVTPDQPALAGAAGGGTGLAIADQRTGGAAAGLLPAGGTSETATSIERAKQSGALHADTIGKVGQIARDNPADAVAVVRSWLVDAA